MAYDVEWSMTSLKNVSRQVITRKDYTPSILMKILPYLGEAIEQDRDLQHSYSSVVTAESKYLLQDECIQQMFMATTMAIASVPRR